MTIIYNGRTPVADLYGTDQTMRLPQLESPERYAGLYIFDFGGQVAVGYTAEEIAVLLESERYADGKVYRIHRALPDGTMELQGVAREKFFMEDGLFFYRGDGEAARSDFAELERLATNTPPPCRMKMHLASIEGAISPHLTVIIFPAEYTHDVSDWLNAIHFEGGDRVEGGISQVTDYYTAHPAVSERRQLWPARDKSRSAEQVLAETQQPIQRKLA